MLHKVAWVCLAMLLFAVPLAAQDASEFIADERFPAPAFADGVDWLNVPAPLTIEDLRGKVVLLDFWTYGCINCIHMIPVLQQLEEKYGDALAVIGVHSAKFANEGDTESIRQIIGRYGLEHPIINDRDFAVWGIYSAYGVNAWPTFAVIDPRGNMFAVQSGEIPFENLDAVIGGMIAAFDGMGEINRTPLPRQLESEGQPGSPLYYPGKVLADPQGGRLFIADSSHNRIVIADLNSYQVLDVVGTGAAGMDDGAFEAATFRKPQGMALNGDTLIVADVENHALRAVNLTTRTVTRIAGTGEQVYTRGESGAALEIGLNSPWDVIYGADGVLYIAMAGQHQLWQLTPDGIIAPLVGSGREGLDEGAFEWATLAQPSGLYYRDGNLYFADSESSSIRVANVFSRETALLAGPLTGSLFDFGDVDGGFGNSRLQHPLAVVGDENGLLYVADTYNSKIKTLSPVSKDLLTVFGAGSPGGFADGDSTAALFDEPGGLSYAAGKLYVADTNNHAVRVIDLASNTVSTVTFPNPEALQIGGAVTVVGGLRGVSLDLPMQTLASGAGALAFKIILPEGYKLNSNVDLIAKWSIEGDAVLLPNDIKETTTTTRQAEISVPVGLRAGGGAVNLDLTVYYCEAVNESLCFIDQSRLHLPLTVTEVVGDGVGVLQFERTITPPA